MFNAISSVVVGPLAIRPRVAPLAVGWLLIVGGLLNLLSGLTPAGLFTILLLIVSGLTEAGAVAGYGWTLVGSTRHSQAGEMRFQQVFLPRILANAQHTQRQD